MNSKKDHWEILSSEKIFGNSYFNLTSDKCRLPDGRIMPKYFVVNFPDWVHMVALDSKKNIVLVNQYRHATKGFYLELPGGSTDPEHKEDPQLAAVRELEEETGYTSQKVVSLGYHCPNPALMSNKVHCFLALDCVKTTEQNLDPYEDIEVVIKPFDEMLKLLKKGEIKHSLMAQSLLLAENYLGKKKDD